MHETLNHLYSRAMLNHVLNSHTCNLYIMIWVVKSWLGAAWSFNQVATFVHRVSCNINIQHICTPQETSKYHGNRSITNFSLSVESLWKLDSGRRSLKQWTWILPMIILDKEEEHKTSFRYFSLILNWTHLDQVAF